MDFLSRAQTLVRVVEAGSLSAAARSLGLSLPAISRQISTLEEELGARLLVRTTRSLRLTEAGQRFHEQAGRLVQAADAARASVRPAGAVGGDVIVSASVTLGALRIVPAVPQLLAKFPALRLDLRLEDRAADLVSEGVDLAVRVGLTLPDTTGLVAQPLATFQRVMVASAAYVRGHGAPREVAELAEHALVSSAAMCRWRFVEGGDTREIALAPRVRVGTMLGLRAAALAGIGVAVLPDFAVEHELASGALRALLPAAALAPVTAHALYRAERRGTPRIEALVAHLRATLPLQEESPPRARPRRPR
jgi:DNA-binding transcriptional LysR family regulator